MIISPTDDTKILNPIARNQKYSDCPNCDERHVIEWKQTDKEDSWIKDGSITCPDNDEIYEVIYQNHWLTKAFEPHQEYEKCKDCVHLVTNAHRWLSEDEIRQVSTDACRACIKKTWQLHAPAYFMSLNDYREHRKQQEEAAQRREARKNIVIPNRYVVQYGEIEAPAENQEHGYTYFYKHNLNLGDIVEVPSTWLSGVKGESGPKLATIVSTKSNYDGEVSNIIRVVKSK